jgi:hypothetical protein
MSGAPFSGRQPAGAAHSVTLRMGEFAWEAIEQESARQGVSVEEMLAFAVMYYLADADSGRIAREISRSPYSADSLTTDDVAPDADPRKHASPGDDPAPTDPAP